MPRLSVAQFGLQPPPKARGYGQVPDPVKKLATGSAASVMDAAPVRQVDPKTLQATQATVKDSAVRNYTKKAQKSEAPPAYVVKHEGTHYLINGHHRAAAAVANDQPLHAHVVDMDNPIHQHAIEVAKAGHAHAARERDGAMQKENFTFPLNSEQRPKFSAILDQHGERHKAVNAQVAKVMNWDA